MTTLIQPSFQIRILIFHNHSASAVAFIDLPSVVHPHAYVALEHRKIRPRNFREPFLASCCVRWQYPLLPVMAADADADVHAPADACTSESNPVVYPHSHISKVKHPLPATKKKNFFFPPDIPSPHFLLSHGVTLLSLFPPFFWLHPAKKKILLFPTTHLHKSPPQKNSEICEEIYGALKG